MSSDHHCTARTISGERCRRYAKDKLCAIHDPDRADEVAGWQRMARRGFREAMLRRRIDRPPAEES